MSLAAHPARGAGRHAPDRGDLLVALADRAVALLVLTVVALHYFLSEMMLTNLGVNYAEGGGNPLEKIHPGTWLALLLMIFMGARRGNPLRLLDLIAGYRGLAVFTISWIMLFGWVTLVTKVPFSPLIDTFLAAIVVFLLVLELDGVWLRRLALMIHGIMTLNALIGIAEYITGWRLTPYAIGSLIVDTDWRSTAILGHPLGNAAMTGAYAIAMTLGGAREIPRPLRPAALGLQLVAMIAFGGRSSLLNAVVMIAGIGLWRFAKILRGQRFDRLYLAVAFLLAPLLVAAVAAAAAGGFFDQFMARLQDDAGSGKTRLIMLQFFNIIPLRDIIIGPDQAYVSSLQALEGIELGIESFWVGFILAHGAIMATVFFLGLAAFCWQLVNQTRRELWLVLLFYFLVASTSVSLSVKTCTFAMFVAMALSLLRPPARQATRR